MRLYAFRYGPGDEVRTEELYFPDDRAAIDYATSVADGGAVEIWQDGNLLVSMETWVTRAA
jgi:hypothetical protein